jgi:SAM-dependent methyltransferase
MTTEATDRARQEIYEIAEAIAPSWERRRPEVEAASARVREWMVRELAPRAGDTVLELAAGVGETGFDVAEAVGERGRLLSTDFAPSMVEAARRRGAERGVTNVEYRVLDAERIDLGAGSVDGVLCRFGYMLMPDPAAAFAETRRVLRPGGRLALAVWGAMERNPFFTVAGMGLVEHGHLPPPEPDGPSPFSLADAGRVTALLERAGFSTVRTEDVPVCFETPGIEEYLSLTADTAGPIGLAVQRLSPRDREALAAGAAERLARFATGRGYEVPGVALCAVAS